MHQQKVFGIGLSKTGTSSLTKALNILGYQAIHYPHDHRTINQLLHADFNLDIFQQYDAVTDTPIVPYYKDFDRMFPGSNFILTVRNIDSWLESIEKHWERSHVDLLSIAIRFSRLAIYQTYRFDLEHYADVYRKHLRDVRHYFKTRANGRLLELDIIDGERWEPICKFLNKQIPKEVFPHLNQRKQTSEEITRADQ